MQSILDCMNNKKMFPLMQAHVPWINLIKKDHIKILKAWSFEPKDYIREKAFFFHHLASCLIH
jgi:hypothetical protein